MAKIYIASKVKHSERWRYLRDECHHEIISTWIDEAGEGQSIDRADLAQRCIQEAQDADCLLLYTESGEYLKGAFIEIGAALGAGTPVYVVGRALPDTSVFRSHPLWRQFESLDQALDFISGRRKWEHV